MNTNAHTGTTTTAKGPSTRQKWPSGSVGSVFIQGSFSRDPRPPRKPRKPPRVLSSLRSGTSPRGAAQKLFHSARSAGSHIFIFLIISVFCVRVWGEGGADGLVFARAKFHSVTV